MTTLRFKRKLDTCDPEDDNKIEVNKQVSLCEVIEFYSQSITSK